MNKYVIFPGNNARPLLKPLFDKRGNWSEQDFPDHKTSFIWKPDHSYSPPQSGPFPQDFPHHKYLIYNHLSNHKEITTKTGLLKSLRSYYTTCEQAILNSYQVHDSLPTSFIITPNLEDYEYQFFITRFNELQNRRSNKERIPVKHCAKNIWLIKPAALNQGKGIEICSSLRDIIKSLRAKQSSQLWVVQKYIEKPLLFNGRKFDIRVWGLATGNHELFYYRKGYIRTSSSIYDLEGKDNFIHLTNNCLQKNGDNYGAYEKGNTVSFSEFENYLKEKFPHFELNFEKSFAPRMKDLMIDSYLSAKKIMHKGKNRFVFELLGFDFLIDEDFRVWLLEVNTNPYLGVPNEYIEGLLPEMLDDMLEITVDLHVPPANARLRKSNDFELIYCENGSVFSKNGKSVKIRQTFTSSFYPIMELAQIPLCKQCIAYRYEDDTAKCLAKDPLQLVKNMLEISVSLESSDFTEIVGKIVQKLQKFEKGNEEIILLNISALKMISSSCGIAAIAETENLKKLFALIYDPETYFPVKKAVIEVVVGGLANSTFRKQAVAQGVIKLLVFLIRTQKKNEIQETCANGLILLCNNPTKNIYLPGKSRDYMLVKEKLLSEGGVVCLLYLLVHCGIFKENIDMVLNKEFGLNDWKNIIVKVNENLHGLGDFPDVFPWEILIQLKNMAETIVDTRLKEIAEKKNNFYKLKCEEAERQKEIDEKIKILEEEKRIKVEEYISKKNEKIKQNKISALKTMQLEKKIEDKMLEEKRAALELKKQKLLEQKQSSMQKKDKGLIKLECARKQIEEKNRIKLVSEWVKFKNDLEKSIIKKKTKSRLKADINKLISDFKKKDQLSKSSVKITDNSFSSIKTHTFAKNPLVQSQISLQSKYHFTYFNPIRYTLSKTITFPTNKLNFPLE